LKKIFIIVVILFISLGLYSCSNGNNSLELKDKDIFVRIGEDGKNDKQPVYYIKLNKDSNYYSLEYFRGPHEYPQLAIIGFALVHIKYDNYEGLASREMLPIYKFGRTRYIKFRDIDLVKISYSQDQILDSPY